MNSFYSQEELAQLGLRCFGRDVLISRKASIYNPEKLSIGHHVRIDDFCILSGDILIGSYVHISAYTAMYGKYRIEMEDCTGLSPRCTLFSASDDFGGDFLISPMIPHEYTNVTGGPVILRRFCQIGSGSVILPAVTLNEGVAVGAMSLVKRDLDAWGIYAGNPLRFIKQRNNGLLRLYKRLLLTK
jgi:galactoside O-acetyltransferase